MRDTSPTPHAASCSNRLNPTRRRLRTRRPGDRWEGLSPDVIERFIDVMAFERGLPRDTREAWCSHLRVLDGWCQVKLGRTLIGVHSCGLRDFVKQCVAAGLTADETAEIVTALRAFYRYLYEARYRDDDPSCRPLHSA